MMKNEDRVTKYDIVRNLIYSFQISYKASPRYFLYKCLLLMVNSAFPFVMAWLWKELINAITQNENERGYIFLLLGCYLVLNILDYLKGSFDNYVDMNYTDAMESYKDDLLITKSSKVDLAFFDSASLQDKFHIAQEGYLYMTEIIWVVFNILSDIISVILAFIILSKYNILLGIITIVLLIPGFLYDKKHAKKRFEMRKELTRDARFQEYYEGAFNDRNMLFEMKLNAMGNYFLNKFRFHWQKIYKANRRDDIKHGMMSTVISLLNVSSDLIVILMSTFDVVAGAIGVGDLQYNLSITGRLRNQCISLLSNVNNFLQFNLQIQGLRDFNEITTIEERSGTKIPARFPEIEFENVSFQYPNTDRKVLENCSFTIHSHEKIGLIGLNGSGKSTIVKLLFRFYDPNEGRILIDGIDAREYDIYALRKVFSVLFQDYVTYDLPLREAIALSDYGEVNNDKKLCMACEKSGFIDIIKDWPDGFDSYLGRTLVDEGKDLSGGQWQLLGITRAYFRDADFVILDEPSASLDPITEDRIFRQLYELSLEKAAITISHRLSNTTLSDRILVLQDGRITEQGSHYDLLKQKGIYYHLFSLQAKRYE